jgi:hypothetical protein
MKNNKLQKYIIINTFIVLGIFHANKISNAQTWVQTLDQVKNNTQQITNIENKIIDLKDNYRLLYDGAKNQNDQLGDHISFAGYSLGIFSFILTILGIFLALYINRQYDKVKEMKDIVEITKKAIDGHSTDLYKKLKREETLSLLMRLEEVPEDITNICPLLLSRDLLTEDFSRIRVSYLKTKDDSFDRSVTDQYIILLTQHFPYESLKDIDIKIDIVSYINNSLLQNMFSRDIKNLFVQVFKYLKESGISDEQNKIIIKKLLYHYSKSRFQPNMELHSFIKEVIIKSKLNLTDISDIAKEQAPTDQIYIDWLNLIFTS